MSQNQKGILELIDGLTPVNPTALAGFVQTMNEDVIPKIVQVVQERRLLAVESRQNQLKL